MVRLCMGLRGAGGDSGMTWTPVQTLSVTNSIHGPASFGLYGRDRRFALGDFFQHGELFGARVIQPAGNFGQRAMTAAAQAAPGIDHADLDARRVDVIHAARALAAIARAARDKVSRPSSRQMNPPASISLPMSTPVSMPRPSSM